MSLSFPTLVREEMSSVRNNLSPDKNRRHPELGHQASRSVSYTFLLFMNCPAHNILLKQSKWTKEMTYVYFILTSGFQLIHSFVILAGSCCLSGPASPSLGAGTQPSAGVNLSLVLDDTSLSWDLCQSSLATTILCYRCVKRNTALPHFQPGSGRAL